MDISVDCIECQMAKNSTYGKTFNLIEKHSTYRQKEFNLTSKQFNNSTFIVTIIRPDIEECMLIYF